MASSLINPPLAALSPGWGHLILPRAAKYFGLIIRFLPGCTILFPLALIAHSNLPIRAGEERHSMQYCTENQNDVDIMGDGEQQAID